MPSHIVALSHNSWDRQWVNRQQLLSRLGKLHQVVYSNGAWSTWERNEPDFLQSGWFGKFVRQDNVTVDHPGRNILRVKKVPVLDRLAIALHVRRLNAQFSAPGPRIAYICHPAFWPYVQALRPDFVVYHCYDLYERQPGWSAALDTAERELLRTADLVFSPSTMLSDMLVAKAPCHARVLPNAADVQAIFAATAQRVAAPDDLATIPVPRIGYIGSIHPQLDLELIAELARRRPEWHFVLIGPELNMGALHASAGYRACRAQANVHLLGLRHHSLTPAYLLHMQVNIMFYRVTAESWPEVAYPLKLHEYMACGAPIVSVELKMLREFSPLMTFVEGPDAWEAALARVIAGDSPDNFSARRAIAAQHSWEARVDVLAAWLEELPQLHAARLSRGG